MKIFVTGLCTLHWGRLEFGNIGNYYIIEPFFRELHRVFPDAEILTTFQMTDTFIKREKVTVLPMDLYYSWSDDDLEKAQRDYRLALEYEKNGHIAATTPYIDVLKQVELVINVSGDMWGDNAEHVGHNRFRVDLLKMRTAQLMKKKTVLFAGTPGPFTDEDTTEFAKKVFKNFSFVPLREPMATKNLIKWGFDLSNAKNYACPAFLFEAGTDEQADEELLKEELTRDKERGLVGFTICGFNMPKAPYDMWPRDDEQYIVFAQAVEHIINCLGARVLFISHTNGFHLPPDFKLINGRDYPINQQLLEILRKRGNINMNDVLSLKYPHLPKSMAAIIRRFDMFVSGRLHASCSAITQHVPTVFIMHGKPFIRSTKIQGFAELAGVREYVCEAGAADEIISKINLCWENREAIKMRLKEMIPQVQSIARKAFDDMGRLLHEK